jgi:hypothetical protein
VLNEAATGSREYHRGALRNADGDSLFTQPPLKVGEVGVQVYDEQLGLRDVDMTTVSSAQRANTTWCEGVGMSLTERLKSTGEIKPPCATPARMPKREVVAVRKDAMNVRHRR